MSTFSAGNMKNNKCCEYWQSKVDTQVLLSNEQQEFDENDPKVILNAIECLLKLEGNRNEAKFTGATNFEVSQTFEPATVEVASLYYISYLYYRTWSHADAIALVDKDGNSNTNEAIQKAYKSYRKWYEDIKKVGLQKAKEQNLDPLADSDIRWY
ncbi:MAG: hypothetical protein ACK5NT_05315 [Pyrinomonadaceae bacterium]